MSTALLNRVRTACLVALSCVGVPSLLSAQVDASLIPGQGFKGAITGPTDSRVVHIAVLKGSLLTVAAHGSGGLVPKLELLAPESGLPMDIGGSLLTPSPSVAKLVKYPIAVTGNYELRVTGVDGSTGGLKLATKAKWPSATQHIVRLVVPGEILEVTFDALVGSRLSADIRPTKKSLAAPSDLNVESAEGASELVLPPKQVSKALILKKIKLSALGSHRLTIANAGEAGTIQVTLTIKRPGVGQGAGGNNEAPKPPQVTPGAVADVLPGGMKPDELEIRTLVGTASVAADGSFVIASPEATTFGVVVAANKASGSPVLLGVFDPTTHLISVNAMSTAEALALLNPNLVSATQDQRQAYRLAVDAAPSFSLLMDEISQACASGSCSALDGTAHPQVFSLAAQVMAEAQQELAAGSGLGSSKSLDFDAPYVVDVVGPDVEVVNPRAIWYAAGWNPLNQGAQLGGPYSFVKLVDRKEAIVDLQLNPPQFFGEPAKTPLTLGDGYFELYLVYGQGGSGFNTNPLQPNGMALLQNVREGLLFVIKIAAGELLLPKGLLGKCLADLTVGSLLDIYSQLDTALQAQDIGELLQALVDAAISNAEPITKCLVQSFGTTGVGDYLKDVAGLLKSLSGPLKVYDLLNGAGSFAWDWALSPYDKTYYLTQENGVITSGLEHEVLRAVPEYLGALGPGLPGEPWDGTAWQPTIDGAALDSSIGLVESWVTVGHHDLKGAVPLGAYLATSKAYSIEVAKNPLFGALQTQALRWERFPITIVADGQPVTSGYSINANGVGHPLLGYSLVGEGGSATYEVSLATGSAAGKKITATKQYGVGGGLTFTFDSSPPVVDGVTTTPSGTVKTGHEVKVSVADIYDNESPISARELHYRAPGTSSYVTTDLLDELLGSPLDLDDYYGMVPASALSAPGSLLLYVTATSAGGTTSSTTIELQVELDTANISVTPNYLAQSNHAWDGTTWELFLDGTSKGTGTGVRIISGVSPGTHSVSGRINHGSYQADTKTYPVTVTAGQAASATVLWRWGQIAVSNCAVPMTSGYSVAADDMAHTPLTVTHVGDGACVIYAITFQGQVKSAVFCAEDLWNPLIFDFCTIGTLKVTPDYVLESNHGWDSSTWELFVDGLSQGTATGIKSVSAADGAHTISGRIDHGGYKADTKPYSVAVIAGQTADAKVWWRWGQISVADCLGPITAGYSVSANGAGHSSLSTTHVGDGKCVFYSVTYQNQTKSVSFCSGDVPNPLAFDFCATGRIAVTPDYVLQSNHGWDNTQWELFLDGVSQGTSTGARTLDAVPPGPHSVSGRIDHGSYKADTQPYQVTVTVGQTAATKVWWRWGQISVTTCGTPISTGYSVTADGLTHSPLATTHVGDGKTVTYAITYQGQSQSATFGSADLINPLSFDFCPTGTLVVTPDYVAQSNHAWDSATWELFVDGVSKAIGTGAFTVELSPGQHSVLGRIAHGSYKADSKQYQVIVTANQTANSKVWWRWGQITVTACGVPITSGYTVTADGAAHSPVTATHVGDGKCVSYAVTYQGQAKSATFCAGDLLNPLDFDFCSVGKLSVTPDYVAQSNHGWDGNQWELFLDGASQGTGTGSRLIDAVSPGAHVLWGRIDHGAYKADTQSYTVNVATGQTASAKVWWRWGKINVTSCGSPVTSGYSVIANGLTHTPLTTTHVGDGKCVMYAVAYQGPSHSTTFCSGDLINPLNVEVGTATLAVSPGYFNPLQPWDGQVWQLFVDGALKGSATNNFPAIPLTPGQHTIRAEISLCTSGSGFKAVTKTYTVTLSSCTTTNAVVWFDKVPVNVSNNFCLTPVTSTQYAITANGICHTPKTYTLLGDGQSATYVVTFAGTTKSKVKSYGNILQDLNFCF